MAPIDDGKPGWPRAAASAALFRGDQVLLVERSKPPTQGQWSLPGGHILSGERAVDAARREVREETGIEARISGLAAVHDVIRHDAAGNIAAHYVIAVYYGHPGPGEPVTASDASAARFVALCELADYPLTDGAEELIRNAARMLGL